MRYLIALFFPWISFFTMGKVGQGIICLILQITFIGWPIATIWAFVSIAGYHADRRTNKIVDAVTNAHTRSQTNNPSGVRFQTNTFQPDARQTTTASKSEPRAAQAARFAFRPEVQESPNPEPDAPTPLFRPARGPASVPEPTWEHENVLEPDSPTERAFPTGVAVLVAVVAIVLMLAVGISPGIFPLVSTSFHKTTTAVMSFVGLGEAMPTQVEIVFWQSIVNSTNPRDFAAYLIKYPQGEFVWLARNRIAALNTPPPPPAPVVTAEPPPAFAPRIETAPIRSVEEVLDEAKAAAANIREGRQVEAFELFQQAAALGNAEAQMYVGAWYEEGMPGARLDFVESLRWFLMAARNGNVEAMRTIAIKYATGHGVPQNYQEALAWCSKAAIMGSGECYYNMGVLYKRGLGVQSNLKLSRALFNMAKGAEFTGSEE